MSRTVRIVLYVLSILTIAGVIAVFIISGRNQSAEETMRNQPVVSTETQQTEAVNQLTETQQTEAVNQLTETQQTEAVSQLTEVQQAEASEETGADEDDADETEGAQPDADGETTIIFAGDVLFANAFKAGYDANGIEGVISAELLEVLNDADILMVNNEFPFSDRGTPVEDKQYTFRCSPSYVTALQEMGVDIVSLANNHALDYGKEALSDTFTTLDEAGIKYAGAGETVERAQELQIFEINGMKFGFLAVSRVIPEASWKVENSTPGLFSCYDETRLIELVEEAQEECDYLAVYPHWGVEYQEYPEEYQTRIAEKCIEAGADIVVGSHTHCLQGVEYIDGKPVFYSLGNFVFGRSIDQSAIVKVTVSETGEVSYQLIPVYADGGVTYLAQDTQKEQICQYIEGISVNAAVSSDGMVTSEK